MGGKSAALGPPPVPRTPPSTPRPAMAGVGDGAAELAERRQSPASVDSNAGAQEYQGAEMSRSGAQPRHGDGEHPIKSWDGLGGSDPFGKMLGGPPSVTVR